MKSSVKNAIMGMKSIVKKTIDEIMFAKQTLVMESGVCKGVDDVADWLTSLVLICKNQKSLNILLDSILRTYTVRYLTVDTILKIIELDDGNMFVNNIMFLPYEYTLTDVARDIEHICNITVLPGERLILNEKY